MKGRFIAENFISTREILHHVAHTKWPAVFTKIDFSKAFDSLDWDFLIQIMKARGFPEQMDRLDLDVIRIGHH